MRFCIFFHSLIYQHRLQRRIKQKYMHGLLLVIQTISDFLWGTPMTIALIGTGLYLSIKFKFRYITKIKFHFQNTFGKMFKGKGDGEGTVSGFAAACTAMANTIGVGNIGGVATAITMGGPGAIFWMWISALLGMSTKACEIILGQRYRVKYENSMDEYMCDRSFVMKNALGWKKGAFLLAICCFVLGPWTCCVQTESVVNSLRSIWDQTIICDHRIRNHMFLNDCGRIKKNFFCHGENRTIYGNVIYSWRNRNSFDEYQCGTRSRCINL